MTDMTLEQVRDELRRLASDGGFGQMADAIDAHLAKAAQGEAVAWQYRRDGVEWHPLKEEFIEKAIRDDVEVRALYAAPPIAKPAQPVEAVDARQLAVARYTAGEEQRAFVAGYEAALAHPRPMGGRNEAIAVLLTHLEDVLDDENFERIDVLKWNAVSMLSAPTAEQAGEVIDWTDDDVETLRCLRDAVGKYANLKKLWVPTIEKMLTRARHVENATAMPYAQPRPVGVPDGWKPASEIPPVAAGNDRYLQVAVERSNGKVFSFPAVYCNEYIVMSEWVKDAAGNGWSQRVLTEEDDDGDIALTGWYDIRSNSEYDSAYEPALNEGDVLVGWHELPSYPHIAAATDGEVG